MKRVSLQTARPDSSFEVLADPELDPTRSRRSSLTGTTNWENARYKRRSYTTLTSPSVHSLILAHPKATPSVLTRPAPLRAQTEPAVPLPYLVKPRPKPRNPTPQQMVGAYHFRNRSTGHLHLRSSGHYRAHHNQSPMPHYRKAAATSSANLGASYYGQSLDLSDTSRVQTPTLNDDDQNPTKRPQIISSNTHTSSNARTPEPEASKSNHEQPQTLYLHPLTTQSEYHIPDSQSATRPDPPPRRTSRPLPPEPPVLPPPDVNPGWPPRGWAVYVSAMTQDYLHSTSSPVNPQSTLPTPPPPTTTAQKHSEVSVTTAQRRKSTTTRPQLDDYIFDQDTLTFVRAPSPSHHHPSLLPKKSTETVGPYPFAYEPSPGPGPRGRSGRGTQSLDMARGSWVLSSYSTSGSAASPPPGAGGGASDARASPGFTGFHRPLAPASPIGSSYNLIAPPPPMERPRRKSTKLVKRSKSGSGKEIKQKEGSSSKLTQSKPPRTLDKYNIPRTTPNPYASSHTDLSSPPHSTQSPTPTRGPSRSSSSLISFFRSSSAVSLSTSPTTTTAQQPKHARRKSWFSRRKSTHVEAEYVVEGNDAEVPPPLPALPGLNLPGTNLRLEPWCAMPVETQTRVGGEGTTLSQVRPRGVDERWMGETRPRDDEVNRDVKDQRVDGGFKVGATMNAATGLGASNSVGSGVAHPTPSAVYSPSEDADTTPSITDHANDFNDNNDDDPEPTIRGKNTRNTDFNKTLTGVPKSNPGPYPSPPSSNAGHARRPSGPSATSPTPSTTHSARASHKRTSSSSSPPSDASNSRSTSASVSRRSSATSSTTTTTTAAPASRARPVSTVSLSSTLIGHTGRRRKSTRMGNGKRGSYILDTLEGTMMGSPYPPPNSTAYAAANSGNSLVNTSKTRPDSSSRRAENANARRPLSNSSASSASSLALPLPRSASTQTTTTAITTPEWVVPQQKSGGGRPSGGPSGGRPLSIASASLVQEGFLASSSSRLSMLRALGAGASGGGGTSGELGVRPSVIGAGSRPESGMSIMSVPPAAAVEAVTRSPPLLTTPKLTLRQSQAPVSNSNPRLPIVIPPTESYSYAPPSDSYPQTAVNASSSRTYLPYPSPPPTSTPMTSGTSTPVPIAAPAPVQPLGNALVSPVASDCGTVYYSLPGTPLETPKRETNPSFVRVNGMKMNELDGGIDGGVKGGQVFATVTGDKAIPPPSKPAKRSVWKRWTFRSASVSSSTPSTDTMGISTRNLNSKSKNVPEQKTLGVPLMSIPSNLPGDWDWVTPLSTPVGSAAHAPGSIVANVSESSGFGSSSAAGSPVPASPVVGRASSAMAAYGVGGHHQYGVGSSVAGTESVVWSAAPSASVSGYGSEVGHGKLRKKRK